MNKKEYKQAQEKFLSKETYDKIRKEKGFKVLFETTKEGILTGKSGSEIGNLTVPLYKKQGLENYSPDQVTRALSRTLNDDDSSTEMLRIIKEEHAQEKPELDAVLYARIVATKDFSKMFKLQKKMIRDGVSSDEYAEKIMNIILDGELEKFDVGDIIRATSIKFTHEPDSGELLEGLKKISLQ